MLQFKVGYEAFREEEARNQQRQESYGRRIQGFFNPKDGEEARVRFLHPAPMKIYVHEFWEGPRFERAVCSDNANCPYCASGDRPKLKAAYLLIDYRERSFTNRQGKVINDKQSIRLYIATTDTANQLDRCHLKYPGGLTSRDYEVTRIGVAPKVTYIFDRQEPTPYPSVEFIQSLLPAVLASEYDGTEASILKLLNEQLNLLVPPPVGSHDQAPQAAPKDERRDEDLVGEDEDEIKPRGRGPGIFGRRS